MTGRIIAAIAVLFALLAAPPSSAVAAGAGKARIGMLLGGNARIHGAYADWLREGLRDSGYREGRDYELEIRFAHRKRSALASLARELVALKVDVIVAVGTATVRAAGKASRTVPIVVGTASDLVGSGLVASLSRPGGNITGMTSLAQELSAKRLELLKEILPGASRIAMLYHPSKSSLRAVERTKLAAKSLGVELQPLTLPKADDFEGRFQAMKKAKTDALILVVSHPVAVNRGRLIGLAAKSKIPVMCWSPQMARAGCLVSYGTNREHLLRRSARFVVRILKGASPADLPIEQPTKFDLAVNLKVADTLGITIPRSILLRADEVIE